MSMSLALMSYKTKVLMASMLDVRKRVEEVSVLSLWVNSGIINSAPAVDQQ